MQLSADNGLPFRHLDDRWQPQKLKYAFWRDAWRQMFQLSLEEDQLLLRHLTDIYALDREGQKHKVSGNRIPPSVQPQNLFIEFGHVGLTYTPAELAPNRQPVLTASGFEHDYKTAQARPEFMEAIDEMIVMAALQARTARVIGLQRVNFGNTTDPLQKLILFEACQREGLTCTETYDANLLPGKFPFEEAGNDEYAQSFKAYLVQHVQQSMADPAVCEQLLIRSKEEPEAQPKPKTGRSLRSLSERNRPAVAA